MPSPCTVSFGPVRPAGPVGLIQLETRFPRPVGDAGHPATWGGDLLVEILPGGRVETVVRPEGPDAPLEARSIAAAHRLVERGAGAIVTSCGFLAGFQASLAEAVPVPVAASSLLLLDPRYGKPVQYAGILTFDATALQPDRLAALGLPSDLPVEGLSANGHLASTIREDRLSLDEALAASEAVSAAQRLTAKQPGLTTIVLECTNLPPYGTAIAAATGCQVLGLTDALERVRSR